MAYKALYRKYRSKTFDELVGQEHITETLKNAIRENRLAHAYLFTGPRGTGKTSTAKLLAMALNCESSDNKPCGACESCIAIQEGSYPDVIEIDAASNNGVDEVRELIDKVKYSPIKGQFKLYIIDEVHMMSTGAFNALLKTLEEPPTHVIFVLATTEPQKILSTIISRCQRFDFSRISQPIMIERMKNILNEESVVYEESAIDLIAKLAKGGMRDALSILDQCLAYTGDNLTLNDVTKVYGLATTEEKVQLLNHFIDQDVSYVMNIIDEYDSKGYDIKGITDDMIDLIKDVIIYQSTKDSSLIHQLSLDELTQIKAVTEEKLFQIIDILTEAIQKYKLSHDSRLYFELACLKIITLFQLGTNTEVKSNKVLKSDSKDITSNEPIQQTTPLDQEKISLLDLEKTLNEAKLEKQQVYEPTETIDSIEVIQNIEIEDTIIEHKEIMNILVQARKENLQEVQEKWNLIKRYMSNLNMARAASILGQGEPVAAAKNAILIQFEFESSSKVLNAPSNNRSIQSLLVEVFGEEKRFIGISKEEWQEYRQQYIQLRKQNMLPQAQEIIISTNTFKETEDEIMSFAKSLFDQSIIKEED